MNAIISLTYYVEGDAFLSRNSQVQVYDVLEEPVSTFENDFDGAAMTFARQGFNIYQADGFDSKALHTLHPYESNMEAIAVLQQPITISEGIRLNFDQIVLTEPIFDDVIIEGTVDNGATWIRIDTYDARLEEAWERAYDENGEGTADLIKPYSIDLTDFYRNNEVVYLRFRQISDSSITAWGWMVDNVRINSTLTSAPLLPATVALANYPNPFSEVTTITYSLAEKSEVTAELYSVGGQLVRSLIQSSQGAGDHSYQVNTSDLESGTYLCQFKVNGAEKTLKWIKK